MYARSVTTLAAVLLGLAAPLATQSRAPCAPPCVRGVDFLVARYAATGSASIYSARRLDRGMVVAGAIANARTHARTVVVGGGTDLVLGRGVGVTALVGVAGSTDGPSARLYLLPRLTTGELVLSATATASHPLGGGSPRQAALSPLTIALRLTPALQLGAAATVEVAEGRLPHVGTGPSVRLRVPGGRLVVEATAVGVRAQREVRGTFSAAL